MSYKVVDGSCCFGS
ncbi:unnamed protein product [Amaranthus hypochondriacus]